MATTGHKFTSSTVGAEFDHTANVHGFYAGGKWWAVIEETTNGDWYLFENDLATPAAGAAGGWSRAQETGASDLRILFTRTSDRVTLYFDETNQVLHVIAMHGSSSLYSQYGYNSGTNDWDEDVYQQSIGTDIEFRGGLVVDSNGLPWIAYFDATNAIKTVYRSAGGVWTAGGDIRVARGTDGTQRVSNGIRWNDAGAASIGFAYTDEDTTEAVMFAYRADADTLSDAWTVETVTDSLYQADDHVAIAVGNFGTDTTSTIIVAAKSGGGTLGNDNYHSIRRDPDGTWDAKNIELPKFTRMQIAIDETNEEVYVFYSANSDTNIVYQKSTASGTLSWGSAVVVIEDDGVNTFFTDVSTTNGIPVTSSTGLLVMGAISGGHTWWNIIPIAAPFSAAWANHSTVVIQ